MKKYMRRKAFSLAEILIVLVIIAVISIMGLQIAKKGIEQAYTRYYYTGFDTIETALNETEHTNLADYYSNNEKKNLTTSQIDTLKKTSTKIPPIVYASTTSPFRIALERIFDVEDNYSGGKKTTITTINYGTDLLISHKNGIDYIIEKEPTIDLNERIYRIIMSVPAVKTKNRTKKSVSLLYRPDETNPELRLIPTEDGEMRLDDNAALLPYMIDDTENHTMGKLIISYQRTKNGDLVKKEPIYTRISQEYSFRQAYCTVYDGEPIRIPGSLRTVIKCQLTDTVSGIKMVNIPQIKRIKRKY